MTMSSPTEVQQTSQPLLTVNEVARLLNLSIRSVWRLRSAGRIPQPVTIGGSIRWKEEDLRKWIAEGCREPT